MFEKKVGKVPLIWLLTGAILFLFLIGLVVEGVLSFRAISTTRASLGELGTKVEEVAARTEQLEAGLERASAERAQLKEALEAKISSELEDLETKTSKELGKLEERITVQEETTAAFQLQVLLLKASGKALKARIHLAEEETGLAKRDLRECDATLEAAMAFADEETKASLKELRGSMTELRGGIEAETFPLTTLEILIDRIEALIGQVKQFPPPHVLGEAQPLVDMAKADLAGHLGISLGKIEVLSVEATEFPDTSLGVPEPGEMYAQVITPGYIIKLAVDDVVYEYHAAEDRVVLVPEE